jgi:hypothetical protein
MTTNPFESPAEISVSVPLPAQRIRSVARIFRWVGWAGVITYAPFTLIFGGLLLFSLLTGMFVPSEDPPPPVMVAIGAGVSFVSYVFLRTAKGLLNKNPKAQRAALVMSCVLMIGFPVFTIAGVTCFRNVRRYFSAYCQIPD